MKMSDNLFNKDHPCHGKTCNECETCIFDEPIKSVNNKVILPYCNECGYMVKKYITPESMCYDATCSKHMIITGYTESERVIQRNVYGVNATICAPDWCPKLTEGLPKKNTLALPPPPPMSSTYDDFMEKREKMKKIPPMMGWDDIEEGGIYLIPTILRQKRRILMVMEKMEFVLKCLELDDNLNKSSKVVNVYSNDIDVNFIVKYHKF
jgi:hypothetical protein